MLGVSALIHAGIFGISNLGQRPAMFGVVQAPLSVDVVMIEPTPVSPVVIEPEAIPEEMATPIIEEVIREPIVEPKSEDKKTIVQNDMQGTITIAAPAAIQNPAPIYPAVARREGWEGIVILKALIEKDGLPQKVLVQKSSGYSVLDEAAVSTIKRWYFAAAHRGSFRFSSEVIIPIKFQLADYGNNTER